MTDNAASRRESAGGGGLLQGARRLLMQREIGIFVIAVVLFFYFQFTNQGFWSQSNLTTLSQTVAPYVIMATGLVMVMILGEIDLSVGSTFGFAPIIMWLAYADLRLILPISVAIGLLACAAVGLVNGVVHVYFRVPSFVVTLGTFFLLGGLNVILLNGFPKNAPGGTVQQWLGSYPYSEIVWAFIILVMMHLLLKNTRWGMHTFATGGNLIGAREAGIRVNRIRVVNFMIAATLAGFAGILEAMRVGSVDPLAGGANIMFLAISAGVIGGTALTGGVGTMIGAFLGSVVLAELRQGFTLLGVSANTFDVILGVAILILMIFNIYLGTVRERGGFRWFSRPEKKGST